MIDMGIKIKPNTMIGTNLTVDDLFRDEFKSIFIGTGVWRPSKLNIKGESLGHVHYAIEYLRNPQVYRLGKVVGVMVLVRLLWMLQELCLDMVQKKYSLFTIKANKRVQLVHIKVNTQKLMVQSLNIIKLRLSLIMKVLCW